MQLETLNCNNCGAPLAVPTAANFVCCNHCGTNLAVRRDSSVSYTEKVDEIHGNTGSMVQQLAEVRYHQEIAKIDRQWELERQKYSVADESGVMHKPKILFGIILEAIFVAIGIGLLLLPAWPIQIFGLVFVVAGVGSFIKLCRSTAALQRAQTDYESRRGQVKVENFLPTRIDAASPQ
jgi:hypothetical protein